MKRFILLFSALLCIMLFTCEQCTVEFRPVSSSGAKATTKVTTDLEGHTVEQKNIIDRLKIDNLPGSIKHLYLISSVSGQVLIYSTIRGKVTSGSKRLTPSTVQFGNGYGRTIDVDINGTNFYTQEVLGDDGTYGSSAEYIFWFDMRGTYHQQFINNGGVVIHISDQPLAVKNIILNIEQISDNK